MYESDSEPDEGEGYTDDGISHGDESDENDDDFSPVKTHELSATPVEGGTPASDVDNVWNGDDDSEDDALDDPPLPDFIDGSLSDFFPTLNGQSTPAAAAAAPPAPDPAPVPAAEASDEVGAAQPRIATIPAVPTAAALLNSGLHDDRIMRELALGKSCLEIAKLLTVESESTATVESNDVLQRLRSVQPSYGGYATIGAAEGLFVGPARIRDLCRPYGGGVSTTTVTNVNMRDDKLGFCPERYTAHVEDLVLRAMNDGGGLKQDLRARAMAGHDDARLIIFELVCLATGARDSFFLEEVAPLLQHNGMRKTVVVEEPLSELVGDWRQVVSAHLHNLNERGNQASHKDIADDQLICLRDHKARFVKDGKNSLSARLVAVPRRILDAAGGRANLVRFLNECIAAMVDLNLDTDDAAELSELASNATLVTICPLVQLCGRDFRPARKGAQKMSMLRHVFAKWQIDMIFRCDDLELPANDSARHYLVYNFVLCHRTARLVKEFRPDFVMVRDWRSIYEVEAKNGQSARLIGDSMKDTYDRAKIVRSETGSH
jgi:hypothetical protein